MGIGEADLARVSFELLYESQTSRLTRVHFDGTSATVIRKELLGPSAQTRLLREVRILKRLAGVAGVAQLAAMPQWPGSILLDDVHGETLESRAKPMRLAELTRVALEMARALAAIHRHGVIHRDITPANILLSGEHDAVSVIDFGLATTSAEIRPGFTHHNEIVGTLAYLAPEQTGRTGRPVDGRADLYGLGATLYEMATGTAPFGVGDPLQLSHDHLARVPVPPVQRNPAIGQPLSDIIMHLLEKEPDNRYQDAQGLAHDLGQLLHHRPFRVGEHDFPLRLLPPSRLVGRDSEIVALDAAFARSLVGRCRGVLVSGAPGVGKTSLINELRPIVTTHDGWFVSGKFDPHRQDQDSDAVQQSFRALGRLLLAEPEERLAQMRTHILARLGTQAGLIAGILPEFSTLLGVASESPVGDPVKAQVRLQQAKLELLRAIASPAHPVVMVIDDLQWGPQSSTGFIDAVFSADDLEGVLLCGAYRENEVDAAHPLAAMLSHWQRLAVPPQQLRLDDLPTTGLVDLLVEMLRLDAPRAAALAEAIEPRTGGNPFDTVELLNALRRDGVLQPGREGWRWDATALRRHVGQADLAGLLAARIDAMPARTRGLLETMACLGGQVPTAQLRVASRLPPTVLEDRLTPALDDGLLVLESGGGEESVEFRHDRVQEAALDRLDRERAQRLRLTLARRLAPRDEWLAVAADLYLSAVDGVHDPDERRRVVRLFQRGAGQALIRSDHAVAERLLAAALDLVEPGDTAPIVELRIAHLTALYSLGRLADADEEYRTIDRLCSDPLDRARATLVQVSILTNQGRPQEAVELGIAVLRQIGVSMPSSDEFDRDIERGLDTLYRWVDEDDVGSDLRRPEVTDPSIVATAALVNRLMPPAFFCDPHAMTWLVLEAVRLWVTHGPGRTLVGPFSHIAFVIVPLRRDYRTAHRALRRLIEVSEARGYEPDTSQARFLYALGTGEWFETVEENALQAELAREGLTRGGDLQNACFTYYVSLQQMHEYASSLDVYQSEVEAALAFAKRTGNDYAATAYEGYRAAVRALRGQADSGPGADRTDLDLLASAPVIAANVCTIRALAAAVLDDEDSLAAYLSVMTPLRPAIEPAYPILLAHLLQALVLAKRARAASEEESDAIIAELDVSLDWLAARSEDAPANFAHLVRLIEAERAWAQGRLLAAAHAYEAAIRALQNRQRCWHRALIVEHTARFHLALGMEHSGLLLLAEAREVYETWGATAKVHQLDGAYPTLRALRPASALATASTRSTTVTSAAIDLIGIFNASLALSSETTIDGLRSRVVDVLTALTGATTVHLALRSDDEQTWLLYEPGGGSQPVDESTNRALAPLSAIRYTERTREPLVVDDATRDERFARDPYLAGLDRCSLLVVPILNRGELRALLLLENRLIRSAFSTESLDAVMLIAGQLSVSIDNARLYASLGRKVAERTEELAEANRRLELLSITDPLTDLANRRRLEEVLQAEWQRAQRSGDPVGLAMVDIDNFKRFNDRYGHVAGDECLKRVAGELKRNIPVIDLAARYGGEEFAVVMPRTSPQTAHLVGERLRTAVEDLTDPQVPGLRAVTVSVGTASMFASAGSEIGNLIQAADKALYEAKNSGRNVVRSAWYVHTTPKAMVPPAAKGRR